MKPSPFTSHHLLPRIVRLLSVDFKLCHFDSFVHRKLHFLFILISNLSMLINLYHPFLFLHYCLFAHNIIRLIRFMQMLHLWFFLLSLSGIHYYIDNLTKLVVICNDYIIFQFVVGKKIWNLLFGWWGKKNLVGGVRYSFFSFDYFGYLYHLQNENGGCSKTFFSSSYVCFVRRSNSRSWCFQYSSFYFLLWRVAITYQDQCLLCIYICVCVCLMLLYTDIVYNQWEKQCECLQMTSKTGFWLSKSSFVPVV